VILAEGQVAPASGFLSALWLLVALPAAGAAVLLLAGRRADRWGHYLGCATVLTSFLIALHLERLEREAAVQRAVDDATGDGVSSTGFRGGWVLTPRRVTGR
jgi:hypothetical protein